MKARIGFVSNSSTSSFILGIFGVPEPCPHCGRGGTDLVKFLETHDHYETCLEWTEIDERIAELEHENVRYREKGWDDDAAINQEEIDTLNEAKGNFQTIIGVSISFHDGFLLHLIEEMKEHDELTIIQGDM